MDQWDGNNATADGWEGNETVPSTNIFSNITTGEGTSTGGSDDDDFWEEWNERAQERMRDGMLSSHRSLGVALLVLGCLCVVAFLVILCVVNYISRQHRQYPNRHPHISKKKVAPLPQLRAPPASPTQSEIWGMPLSPAMYAPSPSSASSSEVSETSSGETFSDESEEAV